MSWSIAGVRMFVAVVPPERALTDLDEFLAVRREAAAFRWTVPEQWHLTLAFLPAVKDRTLDGLVGRLEAAAGRREPFEVRIAGGGAFPDPARARVLHAGLGMDDRARLELDRLATGARAGATKAGAEVGGARFRPHLTLARLGQPHEVTRWVRLLDTYRGSPWAVDELVLVESHLGEGPRGRPRHETVATMPLGRVAT